jgi:hypothetical protein
MKLVGAFGVMVGAALAACAARGSGDDENVPQIAVQPGAAARAFALTGRTAPGAPGAARDAGDAQGQEQEQKEEKSQ